MSAISALPKRLKVTDGSRIDIRIRNPSDVANGADCERLDASTGQVLEISNQSVRICSPHSFPFYKQLIIEFSPLEPGGKPMLVKVEVQGARPHPEDKNLWANECVFIDDSLTEEIERMIHEMSRLGWLDRRNSPRETRNENVKSRLEASSDDCKLSITDVSRNGIGLFSKVPIEEGRKILLELTEEGEEPKKVNRLTVRAIRQTSTLDGYFIGCEILRGSIERKADEAVPVKLLTLATSKRGNLFRIVGVACVALIIAFLVIRELFQIV